MVAVSDSRRLGHGEHRRTGGIEKIRGHLPKVADFLSVTDRRRPRRRNKSLSREALSRILGTPHTAEVATLLIHGSLYRESPERATPLRDLLSA